MNILSSLKPTEVFRFFEEISTVPRGSGNTSPIAEYCVNFARMHNLKYIRDNADNVVIFKPAYKGYEKAEPIILQGHLDMVCQKTEDSDIDFLKDGISLKVEGDFLMADGTTLGADNGIAVAMILSVLASDDIPHPAIEAVFTSDEEIGMLGALALDKSVLSAKKMINLDSEDLDCMTVSCAGGSDFTAKINLERETQTGNIITINIKGLKGGHSGVCINEGRVNANILCGRILATLYSDTPFNIISVNGGNKSNVITTVNQIKIISNDPEAVNKLDKIIKTIYEEYTYREPKLNIDITVCEGTTKVINKVDSESIIFALALCPTGVIAMSKEIERLVETSLNLGVLKTEETSVTFNFALRSNKKSAIKYLEKRLDILFNKLGAEITVGGYYPPWEFNPDSVLQEVYKKSYTELFGAETRVEAIHAGLECGVFADAIENFDGIAIGPQMYDVHTVNERLQISTVNKIYTLLLKILEESK